MVGALFESNGTMTSHSVAPLCIGTPTRRHDDFISSSFSVPWILAANSRSASSNGGGPNR